VGGLKTFPSLMGPWGGTDLCFVSPYSDTSRLQDHGYKAIASRGIVWCVMSEKCLKSKVFAKIDFIAFLASLGVK